MIGIIDYGMGNLRSVQKAFEFLGVPAQIVSRPNEMEQFPGLILPGVGAFRDAIQEIRQKDFPTALRDSVDSGKPLLGICLGLQLLFETSYEDGEYEGLGLIDGDVVRFQNEPELKIPHMGWNAVDTVQAHPLLEGISNESHFYFVHSFFVRPTDRETVIGQTTHGTQPFASIVAKGNLMATQFHPEKSQRVGLQLLRNYANLVEESATIRS
ncbi:Imidazole glycerol phosphate synthase subunit HisH 1 [Thalassoglobus neptunius]|uniref:Imidazole glycerol phosphate synthase subunit HisH n=1 Tax=Thalassoglobus neptunius TaxID=1938619 RepID=A0A5C5X080_9PLAN|nr:imidazole glycerol phosphate synthase subunit HisH [Thalassoglobus neptunius]TWT55563.1 Imidazole glycerol phosphate synthase subunit HisH 1 [Thalassoglobus neptunius]